jgi:uncharacterized membrane protein
MDRKIKVLALISIIVAAAVGTGVVLALQSTVKADSTASVAQDAQPPSLSSVNASNCSGFITGYMGFGGPNGMGRGFGGPFGGPFARGFGGFGGNFFNGTVGGFGSIQVSSAFTQNVTNILNSSTDVEALFSQGYNVTSIRPVITTTINGNGNVVMQATSANVILQGPNGRAFVVVNLTTAKVTKIVTITVNNNPS